MDRLITSLLETVNGKSLAVCKSGLGACLYVIDSEKDTATKTDIHGFNMQLEQRNDSFSSRIGYVVSFQNESRIEKRLIVDGGGVPHSVYEEIVVFDDVTNCGYEMIKDRETGKFALLNHDGEILCPFKYDSFIARHENFMTTVIYGVDGEREDAIVAPRMRSGIEQYSIRKREAPIHGFRKILADHNHPELQNGGWKNYLSPNGKYDPERILEIEVDDEQFLNRRNVIIDVGRASISEASNEHLETYYSLKMGIVDDKGNVLFPAEFDEIIYNHTKKVFVAYRDEAAYLYDITGQNMLASIDGDLKVLFFDDRIVFYKQHKEAVDGISRIWNDRGVVLDYSGRILFDGDCIPYCIEDTQLYWVRTNNYHGKDWKGSVGLMDECFNMIIPAEYSDIEGSKYGTVSVTRFDCKSATFKIEDGKAVRLTSFSAVLSFVWSKEPMFCFKRGKKNVVVDYDGKNILQLEEYVPKQCLGNGYWVIEDEKTGKSGIITSDGTIVLPCKKYQYVEHLGGSLFKVTDEDSKDFLFIVGVKEQIGYDCLYRSGHDLVIAEEKDGSNRYKILIDQNGKEMEPFAKSLDTYVLSESRAIRTLRGADGKVYSEYVEIPTAEHVSLKCIDDSGTSYDLLGQ